MSGQPLFDPVREAPLLSAYVDGELDAADLARVEAHLAIDAEARAEVARLCAFKNLTAGLRLRERVAMPANNLLLVLARPADPLPAAGVRDPA